jgi:hypothetical protein
MRGKPLPAIAESPTYLALIRETRGQHQVSSDIQN